MSLTIAIIIVTVLISLHGFRDPAFVNKYIFWPEAILGGRQGYRLVTSAFLHADFGHLFFNMYSLYAFGKNLEAYFGPGVMLAIYFGSSLGGDLLALYLHRHHDYRAYGASGGVCGIIYAHILMIGGGVGFPFIPFFIPGWLYAIGYLLISFYGIKKAKDNIGHDAHLGGAIMGQLMATAFEPGIIQQNPILYSSVMGLSLVLLFILVKHPVYLLPNSFADLIPSFRMPRKPSPTPEQDAQRINDVLDKISRSGLRSLTKAEEKILRDASRKNRGL